MYSEELADRICERVARGEALYRISEDPDMPGERTLCTWREKNIDFQRKYASAKEQMLEREADNILAIADSDDDPNSRRVRVDTRKWLLSKLIPKKYGDKLEVEHGEQTIRIRIGGERPTDFINIKAEKVLPIQDVIETDATVESEKPVSE